MASYKLTYLNYRGRAELIRFILAYKGLKFEDCRMSPEKWSEFRPSTEYGILPMLEFDGKTLSGNGSIARYLAEKHGLAGSSAEENAELYSIVEVIEDLWLHISHFFWEKDETRKAAAEKQFVESYLPLTLKKLEGKVAINNAPEGWIIGSKVTYADFAVAVLLHTLDTRRPGILDPLPRLTTLRASVEKLPSIEAWMKKRPETPY